MIERIGRVVRNAFFSYGARRFGLKFSRDYLRFALGASRRWGSSAPGSVQLVGRRVEHGNQTHALFLVHELFVNGAYDFHASSAAPRIIDAGANIGMAVVFFKALYPDAHITAYEPEPETFAMLERNVTANALTGVELVSAAVGDRSGTAVLYTDESAGSITASLDAGWGGATSRTVRTVRLSESVDGPVDFLKLDVEGAEYAVVRDLVSSGRIAWVREAVIEAHDIASEPDGIPSLVEALRGAGMVVTVSPDGPSSRAGLIHARRRPG